MRPTITPSHPSSPSSIRDDAIVTNTIELTAGTISYFDTGGQGPTIVFLHGLLMDSSLWHDVIGLLRNDFRCIAPTLPLGAHPTPMRDYADLSLTGIAALVAEFVDRLDLHEVTMVGNDTGGAVAQLLAASGALAQRGARIALVSCEAFDNVPPGLTGKTIVAMGRLPLPLFGLMMQQMRIRPLRRLPIAFGWLTKRGDTATSRWVHALLRSKGVRRDAVRVLRGISSERDVLVKATAALALVQLPVLIVWAEHDRVMPPEHGRKLAELFPRARLVEVADTYTLIPLDQPAPLAEHLRRFIKADA